MSSFQYDYAIKDHLGSVRMVLTDEIAPPTVYQATMEDASRSTEVKLFTRISESESIKPAGFDTDAANGKVSKLFNISGSDKRVGPGIVLKVMAGDKFKALVTGWYQPSGMNLNPLPSASSIVSSIISAFVGGLPTGSKYSGSELNGSGALNTPLADFLTYQGGQSTATRPKAYLNWMILDEQQFRLVSGNYGAVQIPEITGTAQKQVMQASSGADIDVKVNGYLYVYVSNESQGNVYFDDLRVEHTKGSLVEEAHYYPGGLLMAGISSQALNNTYAPNELKFQGQEFESTLDYNGLEFEARTYDPQLGRWHVPDPANQFDAISPYVGMANNWPNYIDPDGRELVIAAVVAGAVIGAYLGGVSADIQGRNVFGGIIKGAAVGAIGGALGGIGSGSFTAQVLWGAGEGAITGGLSSALNGDNVLKGALIGAGLGAGFGAISASIESFKNLRKYGFGTNDGRLSKMYKSLRSSLPEGKEMDLGYLWVDLINGEVVNYQAKAQEILDFISLKYGGPHMTAVKFNVVVENGVRTPNFDPITRITKDGIARIDIPMANFYKTAKNLKASSVHEWGHYFEDVIYKDGVAIDLHFAHRNFSVGGPPTYAKASVGKRSETPPRLDKEPAEQFVLRAFLFHKLQDSLIGAWFQVV